MRTGKSIKSKIILFKQCFLKENSVCTYWSLSVLPFWANVCEISCVWRCMVWSRLIKYTWKNERKCKYNIVFPCNSLFHVSHFISFSFFTYVWGTWSNKFRFGDGRIWKVFDEIYGIRIIWALESLVNNE